MLTQGGEGSRRSESQQGVSQMAKRCQQREQVSLDVMEFERGLRDLVHGAGDRHKRGLNLEAT